MDKTLSHFAGAFRWSTEKEVTAIEIVVSALAMAVPALLAAQGHHSGLGLVGGMAMSGTVSHGNLKTQAGSAGAALLNLMFAVALACVIGRAGGMGQVALLGLAVIAGVVGGFDRPAVIASMRFVFYLVMVSGIVATTTANPVLIFAVIVSGAIFAIILHIAMTAIVVRIRADDKEKPAEPQRVATVQQKFKRLKRSLTEPAGWQYPARLVLCLAAVALMHVAFPAHDMHWAALALVLLIERRPERMPMKTTQRVIGVLFGVCCAGLLSLLALPVWADVLSVAVLGAARPFLRARNYLAYSVVMTPLMMMAMGTADQTMPVSMLTHRLFATILAACLVLIVNGMTIHLLPQTAADKS